MSRLTPSSLLLKIRMILTVSVVCILFHPIVGTAANPDTTWSASFRLNMSKAVRDSIFSADTGYVYLVMDQGIAPMRLVPEPGFIYTATLFDALDSGLTYHFRFRINNTDYETVVRSVTARPGTVNYTAWWNNDPLNTTTLTVNMKYAAQYGLFDPAADSVTILGTFKDQGIAPKLHRIDTTLLYTYTDTLLDPGSVQQYKYRINAGDTAKNQLELLFQPNRIVRIADTAITVTSDFNNFNPALRLMTFQCNMGYYSSSGQFNPEADFVDVAGNFNGNGANDVLFDSDNDSIFTLGIYLDTAWISQGPLAFRFRINGDPAHAELIGKPDRTYAFHDTTGVNPNLFTCYFNNLDPSVPAPPRAYNVSIQGLLIYKKFLSGIYAYGNVNGIPEGISTYQWYRCDNPEGTNAVAIDSANKITYVVDTLDISKWLVFEVTPKALSGDSAVGMPVRVVSSGNISAWDVGMGEYRSLISYAYPNPASDFIRIVGRDRIDRIEMFNYLNQAVLVKEGIGANETRLPVSQLARGLYLLKATNKAGQSGVVRIIKL